jgi:hypothetical protein
MAKIIMTAITSVQIAGVIYGPHEDFEIEKAESERLIDLKAAHIKGEIQQELKGTAAKVTKASAAKLAKEEAARVAQFEKDEAARRAAEQELDAAAGEEEININELTVEELKTEIDLYAENAYSQENTKEELILILTKLIEAEQA